MGNCHQTMTTSLKTTETDALKILMIQRALTIEKLADDCGVKRVTMSNQIAKNFPSLCLRLVVEDVLKLPIWSSVAEFESRQLLATKCGYDPFALSTMELRQRITKLKIRGRSKNRRKGNLIDLIRHHFSNVKTNSPDTPKRKISNPQKYE
jgi:hypothetical protein